jgi:hypothetical protein
VYGFSSPPTAESTSPAEDQSPMMPRALDARRFITRFRPVVGGDAVDVTVRSSRVHRTLGQTGRPIESDVPIAVLDVRCVTLNEAGVREAQRHVKCAQPVGRVVRQP